MGGGGCKEGFVMLDFMQFCKTDCHKQEFAVEQNSNDKKRKERWPAMVMGREEVGQGMCVPPNDYDSVAT